jgi:hypothetical protein
MDKSKHYIEMCKQATELNKLKWDYGFIDGDWLYLGDGGVRVIGSDTLCVGQSVNNKNGKTVAVIELVHGESISFNMNGKDVDINVLEYPVDSYVEPVWLPRQDQLESFYYQAILEKVDVGEWIKEIHTFEQTFEFNKYKSMEQIALAIIMNSKFDKVWNGDDWT